MKSARKGPAEANAWVSSPRLPGSRTLRFEQALRARPRLHDMSSYMKVAVAILDDEPTLLVE